MLPTKQKHTCGPWERLHIDPACGEKQSTEALHKASLSEKERTDRAVSEYLGKDNRDSKSVLTCVQ